MKLNHNFVLRQIAQMWVVLPLAEDAANATGVLRLNESGVLLWNALACGADRDGLVAALMAEYEVTAQRAQADVDAFINKLTEVGCIIQ